MRSTFLSILVSSLLVSTASADQTVNLNPDLDAARQMVDKALAAVPGPQKTPVTSNPAPKIAAPQAPATTKPADLQAMVEEFNKAQTKPARAGKEADAGLYVLVSLSVPRGVLEELSKQSAQAGAEMEIRGFVKGGMTKATMAAINAVNAGGAGWAINPDVFKRFKVTQVPAIVVAKHKPEAPGTCSEGSCSDDNWDAAVVYGDISLNEALRYLSGAKNKELAMLARQYRAKLEGAK